MCNNCEYVHSYDKLVTCELGALTDASLEKWLMKIVLKYGSTRGLTYIWIGNQGKKILKQNISTIIYLRKWYTQLIN